MTNNTIEILERAAGCHNLNNADLMKAINDAVRKLKAADAIVEFSELMTNEIAKQNKISDHLATLGICLISCTRTYRE